MVWRVVFLSSLGLRIIQAFSVASPTYRRVIGLVRMELFSSHAGDPSSTAASFSSVTPTQPCRVLCYGDSLTAGTSESPFELFPYAPHLETFLNKDDGQHNNQNDVRYVVRHRGMPGWTADAMLEAADDPQFGLRSAVRAVRDPSLTCVVILAGTNDLGYALASEGDEQDATILRTIQGLHRIAWDEGLTTLAVAIPPSGYQAQVASARKLAQNINRQLRAFCEDPTGKPSLWSSRLSTTKEAKTGARIAFTSHPWATKYWASIW